MSGVLAPSSSGSSESLIGLEPGVSRVQRVQLLLSVVTLAALLLGALVSPAPNRLSRGIALSLWASVTHAGTAAWLGAGLVVLLAGGLLLGALRPASRGWSVAAASGASLLGLALPIVAGLAAHGLANAAGPALRVSLGAGFWMAEFGTLLLLADALQRLQTTALTRVAIMLALSVALAALAYAGVFDDLSLLREYASRRAVFGQELLRHLLLALSAVASALLLGIPLGLRALSRPRFRAAVFNVLNLLQTIPAVALFGLLIAPLAWLAHALPQLHVHGIGLAPAWIALTGYALLPIVRHTFVGFGAVDPAAIETANGLGFSRAQRRWQIELPLALPALLAGLRAVLVQVIGLTVVAALIGAGGLGSFVFQGISQYATDLVLLGVLPTIFLALAADFAVALAQSALTVTGVPT